MHEVSRGERPNEGLKFVSLASESGLLIEFIESMHPIECEHATLDLNRMGINHIAFAIKNIEQTIAKAIKAGTYVRRPIEEGVTVKRIAFIEDPNGIFIELIELREI